MCGCLKCKCGGPQRGSLISPATFGQGTPVRKATTMVPLIDWQGTGPFMRIRNYGLFSMVNAKPVDGNSYYGRMDNRSERGLLQNNYGLLQMRLLTQRG